MNFPGVELKLITEVKVLEGDAWAARVKSLVEQAIDTFSPPTKEARSRVGAPVPVPFATTEEGMGLLAKIQAIVETMEPDARAKFLTKLGTDFDDKFKLSPRKDEGAGSGGGGEEPATPPDDSDDEEA